jgi:hypothetical protein
MPIRPNGDADDKSAEVRSLLERLLDLAYDASTYLRQHAQPAVRVSAALLLAASLAACGPSGSSPSSGQTQTISSQPLSQEVRSGLPSQPGNYPVVGGSVSRDTQGVYHFAWLPPQGPSGAQQLASVSDLRLAQSSQSLLEISPQGAPTLFLPPGASIPLVPASAVPSTPVPVGGSYYPGGYGMWYPFYGGYRGPGYYDPPVRTVAGDSVINGARVSSAPAPPSSRTVDVAHAVSGKSGGTGGGSAATNKSGASAKSGASTSGGGSAGAKSGGFSSGHSSSGGSGAG